MSKKLFILILFSALFFGILFLPKIYAQEQPKAFCGDGIVQSPNSDGFYERCDDSAETERCTADCGQKMLGWAWSDNIGWISLNNENCDFLSSGNCINQDVKYYVQATAGEMTDGKIRGKIFGWAWSDNIGWICFGQTCQTYAGQVPSGGWYAYAEQESVDEWLVFGWAWNENIGLISLSCGADSVFCQTSNYQVKLVQSTFGDNQRLTLLGWVWSDVIGWISFTPEVRQISPWLQTKYGDIYARRGISGQAPPDYGYNATYQIISGGDIINFRSARGLDWIREDFHYIGFPRPSTRYSNVLGQIKVSDLLCNFIQSDICVNRLGKTVSKIPTQNYYGGNIMLDGKIYYREGDLFVDNSVKFMNASGFSDGSGTIIVDGDLVISADIKYDDSNNLSRFKNLASVAWIIKGDLKILPGVKELAGNFIVVGSGIDCSDSMEVPHCGQIYSCCVLSGQNCLFDEAVCSQNPLIVSGLIMARKFYLNRTFVDQSRQVVQGSEIIIYDGRLLANTPPGLGDFAKSMPVWRQDNLLR